jgi:hypothetical protein
MFLFFIYLRNQNPSEDYMYVSTGCIGAERLQVIAFNDTTGASAGDIVKWPPGTICWEVVLVVRKIDNGCSNGNL